MKNSNIGKNIAELRKQKGKTAQQLADALLVSRQTISKWENGETVPNAYEIMDIATYLDVNIPDIYGQIMLDRIVRDTSITDNTDKKPDIRTQFINDLTKDLDGKKDIEESMTAFFRFFNQFDVKIGINKITYEDVLRRFNTGHVMGIKESQFPIEAQRIKSKDFIMSALPEYLFNNGLLALHYNERTTDDGAHFIVVLNNENELLRFKELVKIFFIGLVDFGSHMLFRELYATANGGSIIGRNNPEYELCGYTYERIEDEDFDCDGRSTIIAAFRTEEDLEKALKMIKSLNADMQSELLEWADGDTFCITRFQDDTFVVLDKNKNYAQDKPQIADNSTAE